MPVLTFKGRLGVIVVLSMVLLLMLSTSSTTQPPIIPPDRPIGTAPTLVVFTRDAAVDADESNTVSPPKTSPVPLVEPERVPNLHSIRSSSIGLFLDLDPVAVPPRPLNPAARVVVLLTGHARTYDRCAPSLISNVLQPNSAPVVALVYPNNGNRVFGSNHLDAARLQVHEFVEAYHRYMVSLLVVDEPSYHTHRTGHVGARQQGPASWTRESTTHQLQLYGFFALGLSMIEALEQGGRLNEESFGSLQTVWSRSGQSSLRRVFGEFDVIFRARTDVVTVLRFVFTLQGNASLVEANCTCGQKQFQMALRRGQLAMTPHHPQHAVGILPFSDLSFFGHRADMAVALTTEILMRRLVNKTGYETKHRAENVLIDWLTTNHVTPQLQVGWAVILRNGTTFHKIHPSTVAKQAWIAKYQTMMGTIDDYFPCPGDPIRTIGGAGAGVARKGARRPKA